MFLHREDQGRVCVIRLPERLTMAHAAAHRHAIRDVIDGGQNRLVLDMGGVEFVDSSGLSVLVSALKAARSAEGDVVISGPTSEVQALIELTRLHHLFEIFADDRAAVHYLEPRDAA
jgi:anti-sigma B factor antagonist